MLILIFGVALWWAAHLFKRLLPKQRNAIGEKGKGIVALALLVSVVLMIIGYRISDGPYWWGASAPLKGINNLLMVFAFYLFAADGMKTGIARRMRHPQLTGFSLWAIAHVLVNGDLPSFILFGGLLVWALVEILVINRTQPEWKPSDKPIIWRKELMAFVGAIVVMVVVGLIHRWLGYNPFGG